MARWDRLSAKPAPELKGRPCCYLAHLVWLIDLLGLSKDRVDGKRMFVRYCPRIHGNGYRLLFWC